MRLSLASPAGRLPPPRDETELVERARGWAGCTLAELAAATGDALPADARHAKGLVGQLVERVLGASAGTRATPDFDRLGIELKTIPVGPRGRPRESTFVCSLPLQQAADLEWETSPVRAKLGRVLWVPVEHAEGVAFGGRRLGAPLLWSPTGAEERVLREDWEEIVGRVGHGQAEAVSAHVGRALQLRPKAAHGAERRRAPEADGAWVLTVPRGFYLRARFTETVLRGLLRASGS